MPLESERGIVTWSTSAVVPAWLLGHRWSDGGGRGGAAAAVVAAPARRGAVRAAGRRARRGGRVGQRPQAKHRGGGFIVVELFGRRLEEQTETHG